jgi:hypothetical protein
VNLTRAFLHIVASAQSVGKAVTAAAGRSGLSPLTLASASLALVALLALGWASSPLRLHPLGAAVWALIAGGGAYVEMRRASPQPAAKFTATAALALAAIALAAAAVALVSFAPCGGTCI